VEPAGQVDPDHLTKSCLIWSALPSSDDFMHCSIIRTDQSRCAVRRPQGGAKRFPDAHTVTGLTPVNVMSAPVATHTRLKVIDREVGVLNSRWGGSHA
jgi:hypothetical protein